MSGQVLVFVEHTHVAKCQFGFEKAFYLLGNSSVIANALRFALA